MNSPLLITLNTELADYLKDNPEQLPTGINKDTLWIFCTSMAIDNYESYVTKPYEVEFIEDVRFNNSEDPEKVYTYKIHYKAYFGGDRGIVRAELIK